MGLINCYECNNKVSKTAKICPKCGAPLLNEQKIKKTLVIIFLIFVLAFASFWLIFKWQNLNYDYQGDTNILSNQNNTTDSSLDKNRLILR